MLKFNEFTKEVETKVINVLGGEYIGGTAQLKYVDKVNVKKVALVIKKQNGNKQICEPLIYLEKYYDEYLCHEYISRTIQEIAETIKWADAEKPNMVECMPLMSSTAFRESVSLKLINAERNKEYLQDKPHKKILDLAIIYVWSKELADHSRVSTPITYQILESMNIVEDNLYLFAHQRMLEPGEVKITSLHEAIYEDFATELDDIINPKDVDMYVITNKDLYNGATQLLNIKNLQKLSDVYDDDLYILPSSIHEVMVLPVNINDENMLLEMVQYGNETVEQNELLSYNIYRYIKSENRVEVIYGTKSID